MVTFITLIIMPVGLFLIYHLITKDNDLDGFEHWEKDQDIPTELSHATIFMSEQDLNGYIGSTQIFGTADQVFLKTNNKLVPLDTKTRSYHKVHDSDLNQISIYAHLLKNKVSYEIEPYGYVRTVVIQNGHKSVRYHKLRLKQQVANLMEAGAT